MIKSQHLFSGAFGIERETLRIDQSGHLSKTPHPFDCEHITRDFCENQIELVTPVCESIDKAVSSLEELDRYTRQVLEENNETLWLYSNPPYFESEDDIIIADFTGKEKHKRIYREVLEKKYGKKLMLFSGIHFNFSFSDAFLNELWNENSIMPVSDFKDDLYLKLYIQLMKHSFLLVMLTAASPYYSPSFVGETSAPDEIRLSGYSSIRNSERGYWNQFIPILEHDSIQSFVKSIERYIKEGKLYSASELYLPVRLKPKGSNSLENLCQNGVDHIELRMFDLDPAYPLGIDKTDLKFAHIMIIYLLSQTDREFTAQQQIKAISDHKNAALICPAPELMIRGAELLDEMEKYFSAYPDAVDIIQYEHEKLNTIRRYGAERFYKSCKCICTA